jgi:hypothetical protein
MKGESMIEFERWIKTKVPSRIIRQKYGDRLQLSWTKAILYVELLGGSRDQAIAEAEKRCSAILFSIKKDQ